MNNYTYMMLNDGDLYAIPTATLEGFIRDNAEICNAVPDGAVGIALANDDGDLLDPVTGDVIIDAADIEDPVDANPTTSEVSV